MSAGHSMHFLERLQERAVDEEHISLAMSLYYNHRLAEIVTRSLHLPIDDQRVAVAMEEGEDPPYIILARGGRFITCLAPGMKPTGCHVLARRQLDDLLQWDEEYAATVARIKRLGDEGASQLRHVRRRIETRGDRLSLEDMRVNAELVAWTWAEHTSSYLSMCEPLLETLKLLSKVGARKKLAREQAERIKRCWNSFHCHQHNKVILAHSAPFLKVVDDRYIQRLWEGFSFWALRTGDACAVMRSYWSVGRLGDHFLPLYERMLAQTRERVVGVDCALALLAIGVSQPHLRERVRAACRPRAQLAQDTPWLTDAVERLDVLCRTDRAEEFIALSDELQMIDFCGEVLLSLDHLEQGTSELMDQGIIEQLADRIEGEHGVTLSRDQRLALFHTISPSCWPPFERVAVLCEHIVAVCSRGIEALYLPQTLLDVIFGQPSDDEVIMRAKRLNEAFDPKLPPMCRSTPRPGRNDPCPCESGKKFKRCCGRGE